MRVNFSPWPTTEARQSQFQSLKYVTGKHCSESFKAHFFVLGNFVNTVAMQKYFISTQLFYFQLLPEHSHPSVFRQFYRFNPSRHFAFMLFFHSSSGRSPEHIFCVESLSNKIFYIVQISAQDVFSGDGITFSAVSVINLSIRVHPEIQIVCGLAESVGKLDQIHCRRVASYKQGTHTVFTAISQSYSCGEFCKRPIMTHQKSMRKANQELSPNAADGPIFAFSFRALNNS